MKPSSLGPLLLLVLQQYSTASSSSNAKSPTEKSVLDEALNSNDFMAGLEQAALSSGMHAPAQIETPEETCKRTRGEEEPAPNVDLFDIRTLSERILLLDLATMKAHLKLLGNKVKDPIKDQSGWNLLHEAVYTDNIPLARLLLEEFGFEANAFDNYFGSAVYLVNSVAMAKLLGEFGGNINDQRHCALYTSALDSARSRGKLELVTLVETFESRSKKLTQALLDAPKGDAKEFFSTRANMFKYALSALNRRNIKTSNPLLNVKFLDEEGFDDGGLTAEFINLIKNNIIERGNVLAFDLDKGFYHLRPDSEGLEVVDPVTQASRANEIRFLGYIVGLSIYHKVPLNITFAPIMYQVICGRNPRGGIDMLSLLKETSLDEYLALFRTAEIEEKYVVEYSYPKAKGDELRPWKQHRGELTRLEDLKAYIPMKAKEMLFTPYADSLAEFKAGLGSAISTTIIANHLIPAELKTILVGEVDYKAADWRASCKEIKFSHSTHPDLIKICKQTIEWFWRAIDDISRQQRAAVLKYVTALVSLPIGGFKALKKQTSVFVIENLSEMDHLPHSSTCYNQIRLYPASSYENLKKALLNAAELEMGFSDR